METSFAEKVMERVPTTTLDWLTQPDNPAVAALARKTLLDQPNDAVEELWSRRNEYKPVAAILAAQESDGSWAPPSKDYKKYEGSLWQIHFLGELMADGSDERVRRGAEYAFSRQRPSGLWSCNGTDSAAIPCLTANVGRALARMGYARDERIVAALERIIADTEEQGYLGCPSGVTITLNGYCHMLAPKILLFLSEVPSDLWPKGAKKLRDECVTALRSKEIYRSLPRESKEFQEVIWEAPASRRPDARAQFIAEHPELHYSDKPGWLRFGFPLSYNSDALEALHALAAVGESRREEYEPALDVVRSEADDQMRWRMRHSLNGRMLADVERKLMPSKWITLRALQAIRYFETA